MVSVMNGADATAVPYTSLLAYPISLLKQAIFLGYRCNEYKPLEDIKTDC